jgi:hypothetical protein
MRRQLWVDPELDLDPDLMGQWSQNLDWTNDKNAGIQKHCSWDNVTMYWWRSNFRIKKISPTLWWNSQKLTDFDTNTYLWPAMSQQEHFRNIRRFTTPYPSCSASSEPAGSTEYGHSAKHELSVGRKQGFTKTCRLSWLTNGALVCMSPNGGGEGLRGLSQWVQLCTWSPYILWRSNSKFNLRT